MTDYDGPTVASFYDAYGDREWERLAATPNGRVEEVLHRELLLRHVGRGEDVLDAGCGPGRFSLVAARPRQT